MVATSGSRAWHWHILTCHLLAKLACKHAQPIKCLIRSRIRFEAQAEQINGTLSKSIVGSKSGFTAQHSFNDLQAELHDDN